MILQSSLEKGYKYTRREIGHRVAGERMLNEKMVGKEQREYSSFVLVIKTSCRFYLWNYQ
jgi:hypothetical protein